MSRLGVLSTVLKSCLCTEANVGQPATRSFKIIQKEPQLCPKCKTLRVIKQCAAGGQLARGWELTCKCPTTPTS